MTLELSLATIEMSRIKRRTPYVSREIAVKWVTKYLVDQGFSYAYAKDVARQAWDLV